MNSSDWHETAHATASNNSSGMDFLGIGNAVSGIAGAIGTVAAAKQNRKAQQETNAANLALAKQQNDWNLAQWEREKEYNSPSNQVKLLKEAGLNPLFYGSSLGPNETQAPQSANLANQVAPQMDAGAIGSSLGHLTDSVIAAGQYHLTKRAQDLEERKINIEEKRLGIDKNVADQKIEESKYVCKQLEAHTQKLLEEKKLTEQEVENAKKQYELMEAERQKFQEEYEGIKLDNQQKQMFLDQYADILAAELECKQEEAKQIAAAAYNYITAGDKNKAEQAGIELQTELDRQYGKLDRLGGVVSTGASLLGGLVSKVGRFVKIGKGAKAVAKGAKAASKAKPYVFQNATSHSNPTYKRHSTHF